MRERLPNNLNVSVEVADGQCVAAMIREVALSSGSACASGNDEPSHVLAAIGLSPALAFNALRFGLGRFTTAEEIDFAVGVVADTVARMRR